MEWDFKLFVWAPFLTVLGFLMKHSFQRNENRLDSLEEEHSACKLDLAHLRTHVSENYSTKIDMASLKQEQINASNRIHERLDKITDLLQSKQ